ncbi:zona pellucida-like domain-containing protein 1 [Channa argus]|uniref:zona pellucida-like domain-containing protein 1 n=1 Tax=Channa argus TaxID=215402 RepID=UPI00351FE642
MKTNRCTLRTLRLIILGCQLGLILRTEAQAPDYCVTSETNRPPDNTDINVLCGSEAIDLNIYLCPVYQALYNESLLVLNNQLKPGCFGTADWTAIPPVVKFRIPLNETLISACGNNFKIINDVGSGAFSDFSNVQSVNISGTVLSLDPSAGAITYRTQLLYRFSCRYPLQYLLNNTQLSVSGVNLAIKDNNGTFISTLSLHLYRDSLYQELLTIPTTGLNLKTKIYVAVKATNLTSRFNVLLDRCYATTSPQPSATSYYDLFVGCVRDPQTKVETNGVTQKAQFSFEAFRFLEHKNLTVSTFYVHCVTRLCEVSSCSTFLPNCGTQKVKRESPDVPANATISSPIIIVSSKGNGAETSTPNALVAMKSYSSAVVAAIICVVILAIFIITMAVYFVLYVRRRKGLIQ